VRRASGPYADLGLANLIWPSYGQAFLNAMVSLYPGYDATASFGEVIVGTLYGVVRSESVLASWSGKSGGSDRAGSARIRHRRR
jgi:hypothetical protein